MCFRPPTVEMDSPKCSKCGTDLMLGARKCKECGEDINTAVGAASTPDAHGAPGAPQAPSPAGIQPGSGMPKAPGGMPKSPGVSMPPSAPKPFTSGS